MEWDKENPLNRIKSESQSANSALRDYYLMGAGRSIRKLLDQYIQQDSSNSPTKPPTVKFNTLSTWSLKYEWQDRVTAQKAIDDKIALEQYRSRHMSSDEVLAHIADIASSEKGIGFFFLYDDEGNVNGLNWERVREYGYLVKSLSFTRNGPRIELYSRLDALEKIGRHHGLFTDKIDHTTGGQSLDEAYAKALKKIYERSNT